MKTNYQFTTSRNKHNKKATRYLAFAAFLFLLFWGLLKLAPHSSSQAIQYVAVPIWKVTNFLSTPFSFISNTFSSRQGLINEKERLQKELDAVAGQLADRDTLAAENVLLKEALGRANENDIVVATILKRPNHTPYDTLIVDGGKDLNLKIGDQVISGNSLLLGSITDVYDHSAQVTLFSSPGQKISVLVGTSTVSAEAEGKGNGNFTIKLPRGVTVKEGDSITAPSLHVRMFGIVSRVEISSTDSFQMIYFSTPININNLKYVTVVR